MSVKAEILTIDTDQTDVSPSPSLIERAEGLSRAEAMKHVVGPHLDQQFRPLYSPGLSDDEQRRLTFNSFEYKTIATLGTRLVNILGDRYEAAGLPERDAEFVRLCHSRKDLLYYRERIGSLVNEIFNTSMIVPLTVAAQIYSLERSTEEDLLPYEVHSQRFWDSVNPQDLIEIIERDSFDGILLHLTKGPNSFLGRGSLEVDLRTYDFFAFCRDERRRSLRLGEAYQMQDEKVVGLSAAYHVAAQRRRERARTLKQGSNPYYKGGTDSSGCPVRHGFENPVTGEMQEPLVISAKNLIVAALRVADNESISHE